MTRNDGFRIWEQKVQVATMIIMVPRNTQGEERGASLFEPLAEVFG